jgi:type II secretory pathway pseudopilin PulG
MALLIRLRRRLASEEGSFLIEALVTAAILLSASAGVVLALQTAHAQTGLQRATALATDVAQTKLDLLRTRAYNTLRPLNETDTITRQGIVFTVVSTATPVAQNGAPSGCNNQRARDYMSLKTTVTWPKMAQAKPVVLDTLVAAPVGAGGGLVVSVTGGAGQGVQGIPLALSSGGGSATTDASGCARWDAVSAGTGYALTTSVSGYVQPNGQQDVAITGINIVAEETAQESFAYDRGGSVAVRFQQRLASSTSPSDVPNALLPSGVTLANGSLPAGVTKAFGSTSGATGTAGLFYPFPSSYGIYVDSCTAAQPTGTGLPTAAYPSVTVPAGGSASTTLELPSLNLRVTNNGSTTLPTDIVVRIKTACDTIITNRTIDTSTRTLANPGLPWGSGYDVCVSSASANRRARTGTSGMDNKTYAAPGGTGVTTLDMTAPTSSNSCLF